MKVAIVGGGWAGIAAAVELTGQGHRAVLFEAGRHLGGRARSVEIAGQTLDNGQHILLGAYSETLSLMRQIGINPDRVFDRRPLQVADNSGFHLRLSRWPAPLNLAWGLLTARRVSLREKLATARWMDGLKKKQFQIGDDLSVAAWLDRAGQTGLLRRHLWEPLCLAALNTPAERASARIFANILRDSLGSPRREDTDLLIPRLDLGGLLPDPATRWLETRGADIRRATRIHTVEKEQNGVWVSGEAFDKAIIATAPQHAAKLLGELEAEFEFEAIATVYLQYSPACRLPFPLISLVGGFGQWVVDRGCGLLACIHSGHGPWETLHDTTLAETLHGELGLTSPPLWHKVIREKRATFSCTPDLARPLHATAHPDVWQAGDYTWAPYPATLEGAVRSGKRAAMACLDQKYVI